MNPAFAYEGCDAAVYYEKSYVPMIAFDEWNIKFEIKTSPEAMSKRLVILEKDLRHTKNWVGISAIAVVMSYATIVATSYWVVPFAVCLALFLRYVGHYITLKIAISRANGVAWQAKNGK